MTKYHSYILSLLVAAAAFTSCSPEEVDYYDKNHNGIYFNYEDEKDLSRTINFADSVLTNPDEIEQTVNLNLLGYVSDVDRRFVIKTREVEGYPLATATVEDNVLPAGAHAMKAKFKVAKPEEMDQTYAVELYFDPDDSGSDLGEGAEGFGSYIVYVTESYTEPRQWSYPAGSYLGEFTSEKYKFMVQLTGKTNFYNYQNWQNSYASQAVDEIRAYNKEHPDEPSTIVLPFYYDENAPIEYSKPDYWNEDYDTYIGEYNTKTFVALANNLGATTANENEVFPKDKETLAAIKHKSDILTLMKAFNNYWQSPSEFKSDYDVVAMSPTVDYDVIQPGCWKEYDDYGDKCLTYEYVKKYYGDYSDEKYKFMIKTWAAYTTNTEDLVFVQLFPIYSGWKEDWSGMEAKWDEGLGGEAAMKECARVIKAEYDKNPSAYNFTFPTVE